MTHELHLMAGLEKTVDGVVRASRQDHSATTGIRTRERTPQNAVVLSDLDLENALRVVNQAGAEPTWPAQDAEPAVLTFALQQLIDQLVALTMEDGLTGLFNRRYFDRRLVQELQRAFREKHPCSVCLVDADNFKRINDQHGHGVGDQVLKELARATRHVLRTTDEVTSRVGGEEFAVILPNTDAIGAMRAAERMRAQIERLRVPAGCAEVTITVSIGVATFTHEAPCESAELIRRADVALYAAKDAGKNTVRVHGRSAGAAALEGVSASEKEALFL